MAIKTLDIAYQPKLRNGLPVKGRDDKDLLLKDVIIMALDEVDLRPIGPNGEQVGREKTGDIRERIALADKLEEAIAAEEDGDATIPCQLESREVTLIETALTAFLKQPALSAVLKALTKAVVEVN